MIRNMRAVLFPTMVVLITKTLRGETDTQTYTTSVFDTHIVKETKKLFFLDCDEQVTVTGHKLKEDYFNYTGQKLDFEKAAKGMNKAVQECMVSEITCLIIYGKDDEPLIKIPSSKEEDLAKFSSALEEVMANLRSGNYERPPQVQPSHQQQPLQYPPVAPLQYPPVAVGASGGGGALSSSPSLLEVLKKAKLESYYDMFVSKGGDDVEYLCNAGDEEFQEIMRLVGMDSKPIHVMRLKTTLKEWGEKEEKPTAPPAPSENYPTTDPAISPPSYFEALEK